MNPGQINIRPISQEDLDVNAKNFPLVPPSHKPNVDRVFLRQLASILRIAFPSWRSKEGFILVLHSTFLVLRTVLSVGVARLDGRIVRDLVFNTFSTHWHQPCLPYLQISADGKGFLKGIGLWFALAVPSIYTNTMVSPGVCTTSFRSLTLASSCGIFNRNFHSEPERAFQDIPTTCISHPIPISVIIDLAWMVSSNTLRATSTLSVMRSVAYSQLS